MENNNGIWLNDKQIFTIILTIIGLTIILAGLLQSVKEFSNNVTLVVEVGVGIIVAIIVFRSTKKSENQNQRALKEMKDYVKEIHRIEEEQSQKEEEKLQQIEKKQQEVLIEMFKETMFMAHHARSIFEDWDEQLKINPETRKNNFHVRINSILFSYERYLKLIDAYSEFIDPEEMQGLNFMHTMINNQMKEFKQNLPKEKAQFFSSAITGIQQILERKISQESEFYQKNIAPYKNKTQSQ